MDGIVFLDVEVDDGGKVKDVGAVRSTGEEFHSNSLNLFCRFLRDRSGIGDLAGNKLAVCGHNVIHHDLTFIGHEIAEFKITAVIDTLYWSPLLFPKKPYHKLVKDDKLTSDELNNPLNDSKKARDLFFDEVAAWKSLDDGLKAIYFALLYESPEFAGFFTVNDVMFGEINIETAIRETFAGKICENAPIMALAGKYPVELAYALSQISVIKHDSTTPPWVLKNYPRTENVLHFLRGKKCMTGCAYCDESLDEIKALNKYFHYPNFRLYDGQPLQRNAAKAAIDGKSLLAIFPTGGGKSITFQLPALMAGENERGLTVIISPLQSLMKDQTDNLERQHNITDAVTINGSLDPIERAKSFERVEDGSAALLYISPESLRSKSIEGLLLKRNIVRFVIDESHCFSAWGQDFRTDYLYIGDFIKTLQEKKDMKTNNIPVSCFTATAKQKVIADIIAYFKQKLGVTLELFRASAARTNLTYHIFNENSNEEKYAKLRNLIIDNDCPTIIYVSRTRRTEELAQKISEDGYPAKPYHGQMDKNVRVANQDAFMSGAVKIIVATTAFGMGVDKKDVGMVIHYDISDSLENYVQEAGRAGRDEKLNADCYVLFNDEDLNKHFNLLNQNRVSRDEIQQVWRAIKGLTATRASMSKSALEIARLAGWDDSVSDMETRIKTAVNALEQSGFVKRGQNMPRVYANSILVKNMEEAGNKIRASVRFDDKSREAAIRIISNLISARSKTRGAKEDGEARVDYISERLGIVKEDVVRIIGLLREEGILADEKDLVAYVKRGEKTNRSKKILHAHRGVEIFLCGNLDDGEQTYNIKDLNERLSTDNADLSINHLLTIINYWDIKRLLKRTKEDNKNYVTLKPYFPLDDIKRKNDKRGRICDCIIDYLYEKAAADKGGADEAVVGFSILELKSEFDHNLFGERAEQDEIEDALYFLLKIDALKIEGGFLVIYSAMQIERLERNSKAQYKKEHYAQLDEYYKNRMQQIHIVGEYANRMIADYKSAMEFVDDYFTMQYDFFLNKYFRGRMEEITKNITPKKFKQLFGELSPAQLSVVKDRDTPTIVVAAGPGSGKTKLLAHKLASLYMMEDVKHEQMLMLTFSRSAAVEFKKRLMGLIGNAANFIQIATFHSYCFDLLGKVGDLEKAAKIIEQTAEKIKNGEVDLTKLTKTVLVIDEAQDMSAAEFSLIKAIAERNDGIRIIAVGDDDQNIYEWRGSSSKHLEELLAEPNAKKYELVENFRSTANIVEFANRFAETISHRIKTTPIMPKKRENGIVSVTKLSSGNVVVPIVNAVLDVKSQGTTAILTRTNDEALNVVGLLIKNGISARLIQSNTGFNLYDLAELRDFITFACGADGGFSIHDEIWRDAKYRLGNKYERSENLRGVLKLIGDFEATNNKTKYKSDLKQFVRESKLEDLIDENGQTVMVSTIHQAKGREFDNVFLALSPFPKWNDEVKRAIYVAITRAKQNLYIHYCGDYFKRVTCDALARRTDATDYPNPEQIVLQLSHKDVVLDYFAYRQSETARLQSGDALRIESGGLFYGDKQVVKFSAKFTEDLAALAEKGYRSAAATVRRIVWWRGEKQEKELQIVLPEITLARGG